MSLHLMSPLPLVKLLSFMATVMLAPIAATLLLRGTGSSLSAFYLPVFFIAPALMWRMQSPPTRHERRAA